MLNEGMPLHLYNPTYMVQQSNNLFGQHQQHLGDIYRPENGYISSESAPHSSQLVYNAYDYVKPTRPAASAGQIYTAAQDVLTELQNLQLASSQLQQLVPSTQSTYQEHEVLPPDEVLPTFAQLIDPKYNYNQIPDNTVDYNAYQQQSYDDFKPQQPIENNQVNQFQEFVDQRQNDNEKILQRAQDELFKKQQLVEQHSISAHDLHQQALVEQFKSTPLRIVVPDEEESNDTAQKRIGVLFTEDADYFEDGSEITVPT